MLGAAEALLTACGIQGALPDGQQDPGVLVTADPESAADAFIAAMAQHRHFARDTDPPRL